MATLGGYPAPAVKTITVEEGSFQMLVCDPTKVTPNATYLWGVTSSTTDPNVIALTLSDRINVDNKGDYRIYVAWLLTVFCGHGVTSISSKSSKCHVHVQVIFTSRTWSRVTGVKVRFTSVR